MKKKIGIVTLHAVTNYGGILQSYAMQTVLERLDFDVEKIEHSMWPKQLSIWQKITRYPYRWFIKRVLRQDDVEINAEQLQYNKKKARYYNRATFTMQFVEKHIKRSNIFSYSELNSNDYYALVVGSDQIWRPQYVRNVGMDIRDVYLQFAKSWNVKRIAYAASFGKDVCEYTPDEIKDCGELLKKFDAVSVRESSGIEICKLLGRNDACRMIDPTLLLSKEDYCNLVPQDYTENEGDLLCYVLDKTTDITMVIDYVAREKDLVPFEVIAHKNVKSKGSKDYYQPPVEKWLKGFMDAKFVITDSFHACVFAIIFGKPFVVIANPDRGVARYQTLLDMTGLSDRLLYDFDKQKIDAILQTPFSPNMSKIEEEKIRAMAYLRNQLMKERNN